MIEKVKSGMMVTNWMKTVEFVPSVFEEVSSVEEVQRIVEDQATYPSPVRPAGRILSPTAIHLNEGGTTISLVKLNKIHGLKEVALPDNKSVTCIDTECGATLRELQLFAHDNGVELPFSAEIGMATIGGTAFAITKDSAVGKSPVEGMGIGDVGSMLFAVTVVEEGGEIKEYKAMNEVSGEFDPYFQSLLDSYGSRGIAVRMLITTRPKTAVASTLHLFSFPRSTEVGGKLLKIRNRAASLDGNAFAMVDWKRSLVMVEERIPTANAPKKFAPFSPILAPMFVKIKKSTIQNGKPSAWLKLARPLSSTWLLRFHQSSRAPGNFYKADIPKNKHKLTFTYYSFPEDSFVDIVTDCLDFTSKYEAEYGFAPIGFALYFVTLSGKRLTGPYAGGTNRKTAFSFDPFYDQPNDPKWHSFVVAFSKLAKHHGGRPALNQTLALEEDMPFGSTAVSGEPSPRFTSAWLKQFFDQASS